MFTRTVQSGGGGGSLTFNYVTGTKITNIHNAGDYKVNIDVTSDTFVIMCLFEGGAALICVCDKGELGDSYWLVSNRFYKSNDHRYIKKSDGLYISYAGSTGTYSIIPIAIDIIQS